jgi:hypothetical protein
MPKYTKIIPAQPKYTKINKKNTKQYLVYSWSKFTLFFHMERFEGQRSDRKLSVKNRKLTETPKMQ